MSESLPSITWWTSTRDDLTTWCQTPWLLHTNAAGETELVCGTVIGDDVQIALTLARLGSGPALRVQLRYRVLPESGEVTGDRVPELRTLLGQRHPFHVDDPRPDTHLRGVVDQALDLRAHLLQLRERARTHCGQALLAGHALQGELHVPRGPAADAIDTPCPGKSWWERLASALTTWTGERWLVESDHAQWLVHTAAPADAQTREPLTPSVHLSWPFLALRAEVQVDVWWTRRERTQPGTAPTPDELHHLAADCVGLEGLGAYLAGVLAFRAHVAALERAIQTPIPALYIIERQSGDEGPHIAGWTVETIGDVPHVVLWRLDAELQPVERLGALGRDARGLSEHPGDDWREQALWRLISLFELASIRLEARASPREARRVARRSGR